jgi:hypothetical protein
MKGNLILLCYVDNCLIFCQDERKIDHLIANLCKKFILTDEGDVAAYLSVNVNKTTEDGRTQFKLSQPHLVQRIVDLVKLSDSHLHDTPAEPGKPFTRDSEGEHRVYSWSYRSLLGMLNYLCGTRPYILYAVNQCSHFCNDPRLSHKKAAKRIICYLKRTPKEGLILRQDSTQGIQCFVDADFASRYGIAQIVMSHPVFIQGQALSLCMQVVHWYGYQSFKQRLRFQQLRPNTLH